MNTKAVKSFGLALMLAAGVLAVLLALGTFSPQKAAGQAVAIEDAATIQPTSGTAGQVTSLRVTFELSSGSGSLYSADDISVNLNGFGVPADIDEAAVIINAGGSSVKPSSVSVDDSTVTATIPPSSDGGSIEIGPGDVIVTFTRAAGITAPTAAGIYPVTVTVLGDTASTDTSGNDDPDADDGFSVSSSVSISPTEGHAGTEITVTGSALPDGDAEIHVTATASATTSASTKVGDATVSGNTFTMTITIPDAIAAPYSFGAGNYIQVVDSGAATTASEDALTLYGAASAPEEILRGEIGVVVGLSAADPSAGDITHVKIGDGDDAVTVSVGTVGVDTDGTAVVRFTVPTAAPSGSQMLRLLDGIDGNTVGATTVTVTALELMLNPSEVIQGNTVSLSGSGFTADSAVSTLTVMDAAEASQSMAAGQDPLTGGRFNFSFTVPDLAAGEATVTLTQDSGVIGVGTLTVLKPEISITPDTGRKGSEIHVVGSNFPANDLIDISYGALRVGLAPSDSDGSWSHNINVPDDASGTNDIVAERPETATRGAARAADPVEHTVPDGSTTVASTEGLPGATISVTGEAYQPFTSVSATLGGANVGSDVTDANGDYSISVTIPDFRPGSFQTLIVTLGDMVIKSESIEILVEPEAEPTRDAATEFADLIDAGVLDSVFRYNDDKTWSAYNPAAPAAANDLDTVNSGDILWIKVTADGESYGGKDLTTTPNPWTLVVAP